MAHDHTRRLTNTFVILANEPIKRGELVLQDYLVDEVKLKMQLQTLAFGLSVWIPVVIARIRDPTKTETPPLQVPLRPPTPLSVPPGPALFSVPCLTRTPHYTTIEDLIECLDGYTVPAGAFSQSTYILAQPQDPGVVHGEQWSWTVAISNLLYGDYNCGPSVIPDAIRPYYRVDRFTEASGKSFCILSGKHYLVPGGYFQKGWGTVVVPATEEAVSRWIHISAPHPGRGAGSDEGTPKYAAAAFKNTGAKSLLVAGRHRDALPYSDTVHACVEGGEHYSKTDSAHDNVGYFVLLPIGTRGLQNLNRSSLFMMHRNKYVSGKNGEAVKQIDVPMSRFIESTAALPSMRSCPLALVCI